MRIGIQRNCALEWLASVELKKLMCLVLYRPRTALRRVPPPGMLSHPYPGSISLSTPCKNIQYGMRVQCHRIGN